MIRSITKVKLKNKKVLVRVDFNVPIKNGKVVDDFRIKEAIPTIQYVLKKGGSIIVAAHLGRPQGKIVPELSMKPVAKKLSQLIKRKVDFIADSPDSKNIFEKIKKRGEIFFLENLRFSGQEEANDENFARHLAGLADVYVNEAFSDSHRTHSSIVGVPKFLPSCAGLLFMKEYRALSRALHQKKRPYVVIMGGAKVATKFPYLVKFFTIADEVILGGIIANTFLKAKGLSVGKSLFEEEVAEEARKMEITSLKLHLPVDVVVSINLSGRGEVFARGAGGVLKNEYILDIGPDSVLLFESIIKKAKMIIWNGPMGLTEVPKFAKGTEAIALAVAKAKAWSLVGGGDVIAAIDKLGLRHKMNHISTAGGAMLAYLAGEKLPGVEALKNQN
ncbi:MAG: phosphoglycerate kinase [Parcubacteria group bacterium]|nr:phosphoglycerate kinase [Parcubacteria group bacterium]